ncbi:unnamed protein product [Thelazia callipaeda]|uniref:G_PROTEIN_RECEP_F1_2 domain-containing protein n=1 Tax=Thelazia callipaeda TaxID=103827 RepID=A0A158RAS2_THECL|nr:unnamed protein product [Thelazia callipaeda]
MDYNVSYSFSQLILFSWLISVVSWTGDHLKWLPPFNNHNKISELCTASNRELIMSHSGLHRLFRHDVLCWRETEHYVPPRYAALVWFMQSLQYCEVNNVVTWKRSEIYYNQTFQILFTRAAFALVCQQNDDIHIFGLTKYASLFQMLFEESNSDRRIICERIQIIHAELFERCIVCKPIGRLRHLNKMCSGRSEVRLIKMRSIFERFSRNCLTFSDFVTYTLPNYTSLGQALSNDVYFLNLLSGYLIAAISDESRLMEVMMKTRFLLQLFSITAIKLQRRLGKFDMLELNYTVLFEFFSRTIAWFAKIGLYIEAFLLLLVLFVTIILLSLLWKSYKHLSTATALFIFNIIFSNTLFILSFNFDGSMPASLVIAETLNANLFQSNIFFHQIIQETLYSLAQNGSLLGLLNLLLLVLVVINRSMAGKTMRLSRMCVILVFSFVWVFLFIAHSLFSFLQLIAISSMGRMITALVLSNYGIFRDLCDRVSPFHNFGVYLLRGHTFFTLTFLAVAFSVFVITVCYNRSIRRQDTILNENEKTREHTVAQKRREILIDTLLLSIFAFFISVAGQTFVEIAVFWAKNRQDAASWVRWFQLVRIIAFVDPVFNPVLVILRIPTMRFLCYRNSHRSSSSCRRSHSTISHRKGHNSIKHFYDLLKKLNLMSL